jgi:rare lipoprotein A (peptidoglycan hydrolase)
VSVAASDPLSGRQISERASRSAFSRSFDVASTGTSAGSSGAAHGVLSALRQTGGAAIASSAPARPVYSTKSPAVAVPHRVPSTSSTTPVPTSRHTPPTTPAPPPPPRPSATGEASWYGAPAGTCAHPWLALGTVVTVTDLATGRSTTCRVADRGPYAGGRIIDLSESTFSLLASPSWGVIEVRITW